MDEQKKEVAFGCWQLTRDNKTAEGLKKASECIDLAWEKGTRVFDTAAVYGLGESEKILSKTLGHKRNEAQIITKCGLNWNNPKGKRAKIMVDNSSSSIYSSVISSLERLDVEVLSAVLLHRKDESTPIEESLECLSELKEKGYIKKIGLSNHDKEDITFAHKNFNIEYCQFEYSYLIRDNIDLLGICKQLNIVTMSYSSLARGALTRKYLDGYVKFQDGDIRNRVDTFTKEKRKVYEPIISKLNKHALMYGHTVSSLSLRWLLDVEGIDLAITGIKNRNHFQDIEKAITTSLPDELLELFKQKVI